MKRMNGGGGNMISKNPDDPNHLYRRKDGWHWQVFHSSAGLAGGVAKTKKEAIIKAKIAIAEMLND